MARIRRKTVQKELHDPDNHDGVITHLEPDILECEVKWALESITMNKASGGDRIPVELFQILKDDAVKVLHSICQQIWKTQQYQIVLTMPKTWDQPSVIPLDNSIRDYMMATILRRWWLAKGNADQAAVAQEQMEQAEREVRYSLNARIRCGRASQWI